MLPYPLARQSAVAALGLSLALAGCGSKVAFQQAPETVAPAADEAQSLIDSPEDTLFVSKSEIFFQNSEDPQVDILFVNDNSLSMYAEQEEMAKKFGAFTSALADIDWQIAITTTDVSSGPHGLKGRFLQFQGLGGQTILTRTTPQYEQVFAKTITRQETLVCSQAPSAGSCPSGDERPLEATILAMDLAASENARFFRKRSALAVVALSDEDENSDGTGAVAPEAVTGRFATYWPSGKNFAFYGIVVEPGDVACFDKQNSASQAHYGRSVSALARLTGGITGSICAADYSDVLRQIALSVRNLVDGVDLSNLPEEGTVRVELEPQQEVSYTVIGKRILFSHAPQKGSKIRINYLYRRASAIKSKSFQNDEGLRQVI